MTERSGNVIENKGPVLKIPERTGNVYENTGTYHDNPVMLLKENILGFMLERVFGGEGFSFRSYTWVASSISRLVLCRR